MIGPNWWAISMELDYDPDRDGWAGRIEVQDDGFADDGPDGISVEFELHTRYYVRTRDVPDPLTAVIDTLLADAARLGVVFGRTDNLPATLTVPGDGASPEEHDYHPQWRELLNEQAERIGWTTYDLQRRAQMSAR